MNDELATDFMSEFEINFMTGSLLHVATTVGLVFKSSPFTVGGTLAHRRWYSTITGTLLLESIIRQLGRASFDPSKLSTSWFPHFPFLASKKAGHTNGHSHLQARHLSFIVASIILPIHYVVMGSRQGFPALFTAYALSAFGRALLTGENCS